MRLLNTFCIIACSQIMSKLHYLCIVSWPEVLYMLPSGNNM